MLLNDFGTDKEIVLVSVKNNAGSLVYASKSLKNDKEVVLLAVSMLMCASKERRNNKEIAFVAMKQALKKGTNIYYCLSKI